LKATADAVLIHSKQKTLDEILSFCRAWPGRVPLVLVPTTYPKLSFADVAAFGKVGLIICGNHAVRAAVAAMLRKIIIALDNSRGPSNPGCGMSTTREVAI
jgi:phosphoenolpyruvate phosphomutase